MTKIKTIFTKVMKNSPPERGDWDDGEYSDIKDYEIDLRGKIGELFLADCLERLGYGVVHNDVTDRTKKHWDLRVKDGNKSIDIEVKLATMGTSGTFQYEGFEKDRSYDAAILIAVAPNEIFITCATKDHLPFNSASDIFTLRKKKMHRRGHGIQYKWTLSFKDVESREIASLEDFQFHFEAMIKAIKK